MAHEEFERGTGGHTPARSRAAGERSGRSEAIRILNALQKTSNPVGSRLLNAARAQLRRLTQQDLVIAGIREAAALPDCALEDLPGLIENIITELALSNAALAGRLEEK